MSLPHITIVGAGLAGLTLGRCLKAKGISTVILEKGSSSPRFNYGVTLHRWAYQHLLWVLQLDEYSFREELAVDKGQGGNGSIRSDGLLPSVDIAPGTFRCHLGRLEMLLREGQDIRWKHTIHDVKTSPGKITVQIRDGPSMESEFIIAADGVHSEVRKALAPVTEPNVLPYVVFNGRRTISLDDYRTSVAAHMQNSSIIHSRHGNVVLQVSVSDITSTRAVLSYTYSRATHANDTLHMPDRPLNGAESVSDGFYAEFAKLGELAPPFAEIFDGGKVRQDRILHWLMRSVMSPLGELRDLANQGVLLLGDAAHAMLFLGGEGANMAVKDGFDLADRLAQGLSDLVELVEQRHGMWRQAVKESEKRLADMHAVTQRSLRTSSEFANGFANTSGENQITSTRSLESRNPR